MSMMKTDLESDQKSKLNSRNLDLALKGVTAPLKSFGVPTWEFKMKRVGLLPSNYQALRDLVNLERGVS